jgi:predicted lysophospholipase L1 biosynthesis ABC-type transport system permease subunit
MLLLLGTATGILVAGAAAGARHRARNRWVSPYTTLSAAMRVVTRTDASEFRQTAGLVGLQPAPHPPQAQVYDLRRERAIRTRHSAAV